MSSQSETQAETRKQEIRTLAAKFITFGGKPARRVQAILNTAGQHGYTVSDIKVMRKTAASLEAQMERAEKKHKTEGWHTEEYPNPHCPTCKRLGWI